MAAGNEAEREIYGGWVKSPAQFNPFVDQSSRSFGTTQQTPCTFKRLYLIVYLLFLSEDTGH